MKTINYLWALLAAATLSLAACSEEESLNPEPQPQGKTAQLRITIQEKPMAETRSTGASLPSSVLENKTNRIVVAIFNEDNTVNAIEEFTTRNIEMNCKTGNKCSGIMVANAPQNHFAGVTNKATFLEKTVTLEQASNNLPMSGEITTNEYGKTFDLGPGSTTELYVELERLVARISITGIKTGFDPLGQYAQATFTPTQIFLHNAKTTSDIKPGVTTTKDLKTGWDDMSVSVAYMAELKNDISGGMAISSVPTTDHYWFYTFPNDATLSTRLVIRGKFDPDGGGSQSPVEVYYPIVVNKLQAGTTIKESGSPIRDPQEGKGDGTIARNRAYTITVTIKGKGVANPNVDMTPTTLNISASLLNWGPDMKQDVEFN